MTCPRSPSSRTAMNDDNTSSPRRIGSDSTDEAPTGRTGENNQPADSRPASGDARSRRRFLRVASVAGVATLAGCSVTIDESGIYWGDDEGDSSEQAPRETETRQTEAEGTATPEPTAEETDTPTPEETDTPEPTPKPTADTYRVGDFQVTSNYGDIDVYGKISMRGIYDEDEYINPRGHSNWEVWSRDEDGYLSIDEGIPRNVVGADSTIEFPADVVADPDQHEPYVIVRVDLSRRREALSNQFLGWNSTRTFLEEFDDTDSQEIEMEFTGEGNDVTMSYLVTATYE